MVISISIANNCCLRSLRDHSVSNLLNPVVESTITVDRTTTQCFLHMPSTQVLSFHNLTTASLNGAAAVIVSLAVNNVAAATAGSNCEAEGLAIGNNVVGVLFQVRTQLLRALKEDSHLIAVRRSAVLGAVSVDTANANNWVTTLELGNGVSCGRGNSEASQGGEETEGDKGGLHVDGLTFLFLLSKEMELLRA